MLTNPMETQLVASLGVKVGGRTIDEQPFELIRSQVANGGEVFDDVIPRTVRWSEDAVERLERVPSFVRGMVKRIYTDYARERSIAVIDVAVMDRARVELGLEGM